MYECKPLFVGIVIFDYGDEEGEGQGLTLVHFSAQLERFVWDRGCA